MAGRAYIYKYRFFTFYIKNSRRYPAKIYPRPHKRPKVILQKPSFSSSSTLSKPTTSQIYPQKSKLLIKIQPFSLYPHGTQTFKTHWRCYTICPSSLPEQYYQEAL
jgi:hypothetical protein